MDSEVCLRLLLGSGHAVTVTGPDTGCIGPWAVPWLPLTRQELAIVAKK